ncbi:MAG: hypothetical protein JWO91_210, partial [Acidobacteriaceae bacterium]|nr:hypothetical protein [Acidobacteriaceae bacterium]
SSSSPLGSITLPGAAQNMVFWTDNNTVFVPVPTATSVFNPNVPGDLEVLNLGSATISATIPIPSAQYESLSPDGNRLVVLGTNANVVGIVTPLLIGTNSSPANVITGFDRPAAAVFNGSDLYILDCGIECGGIGPASIIHQDPSSSTAGTPVPLVSGGINGGATAAFISGSTMYVAGTPPGTTCPPGTAATHCGILSVVDLGTLAVSASAIITDGYHDRMQMGANGQLFIGANTCTNITTSTETRGCLSIVNTSNASGITNSSVVFPPDNGNVTGIQPITNRNVVYVCEGGHFRIYDTTIDKLLVQSKTVSITGQATDVLLVDGPP